MPTGTRDKDLSPDALSPELQQEKMKPNAKLQVALNAAGFSQLQCVADLGFVGWNPPGRSARGAPYSYKSLAKATDEEIRQYVSDATPGAVVDLSVIQSQLPIPFRTNLPKQVVAQKYPYGQNGIAALCHARSRCDLGSLDFYLGCSALEVLSAEKKTSKKNAPYYATKVPGTNMIMLRYSLHFGQDYTAPGFQFERLVTGKPMEDRHDVGFVEHVQIMKIANFTALMAAEADAKDDRGDPSEIKLLKKGGGAKLFFQMVGSGSMTLRKGRNDKGRLVSVTEMSLQENAESFAQQQDATSLEAKMIRNMEQLKEWDRQGKFDGGKTYRIDFNPGIDLHPVAARNTLLPPEPVIRQLLQT